MEVGCVAVSANANPLIPGEMSPVTLKQGHLSWWG